MQCIGGGLSIDIGTIAHNNHFLSIKAIGGPTREAYHDTLSSINTAVQRLKSPKALDLYVDLSQIEKCDLHCVQQTLISHLCPTTHIDNVAIYAIKSWHGEILQCGHWFDTGETRCFERCHDAIAWLRTGGKKL